MDQASKTMLQQLAVLADDMGIAFYLVGGSLRDQLLGRPCVDYDLICADDPTPLARQLARNFRGHWFWLDESRRYSRVVIPAQQSEPLPIQFDFAPFRAPSLEQDLAERDFTINAIACFLTVTVDLTNLIDPLHGQCDLEQRILRQCGPRSMVDDPLRILKGLRHCAQLSLTIDSDTWQQFTCHADVLRQIAGERIRHELALIFSVDDPQLTLDLLWQSGVATALGIPEPVPIADQTPTSFAQTLDDINRHDEFRHLLDQQYQEEFSLRAALKLSCYFSGLRNILDVLPELLKTLRLSRRLSQFVLFCCRFQLGSYRDYAALQCQQRGRLLWLEQQRAPLPEALVAVACVVGDDVEVRRQAFNLYFICTDSLHNGQVAPLVSGRQLHQYRPDLTGGALGCFFKALKQAEIDGMVNSHEQAEIYLINWRESD